ncbi:hypothetical protein AB0J86_12995 [Micromonospora sp. NPDC049559]|uniref:hypothetical protein n=1 Tax=Micromonospora sp. NPDC049559 TaxID=3155923 RepID=UPI00342021DD
MAFDVRVQLGQALQLTADDRRHPTDGPVTLWVTGVRLVANRPEHDAWIWLEGMKIMHGGQLGDRTQVLVRASRLRP